MKWGDLALQEPISRKFGFDRGQCVDRFFIEQFLHAHRGDVRGRVLEVAEDTYTRRFGEDRVTRSDVLHLTGCRSATIVGDLATGDQIPSSQFDCVILTQTLQHIFDTRSALATVYRALAPDGVLLASVPGISQISRFDMDRWGDFWRFTSLSLRRLLLDAFPESELAVQAKGNVLAAVGLLHGLCVEDLPRGGLDLDDPDYELVVLARVQKRERSK